MNLIKGKYAYVIDSGLIKVQFFQKITIYKLNLGYRKRKKCLLCQYDMQVVSTKWEKKLPKIFRKTF